MPTGAVIGLLQHANLDLRLGPLNYVSSAAPVHLWRHSLSRSETDRNLGVGFKLLGSCIEAWYRPSAREADEIAISRLDGFPHDFVAQLAAPFRWHEFERASVPMLGFGGA